MKKVLLPTIAVLLLSVIKVGAQSKPIDSLMQMVENLRTNNSGDCKRKLSKLRHKIKLLKNYCNVSLGPKQNDHDSNQKPCNCLDCDDLEKSKADIRLFLCKDDMQSLIYDNKCGRLWVRNTDGTIDLFYPKKFKLRYNEPFKIRIVHVNRYVYDVAIKADDVYDSSAASSLFNNFFGTTSSLVDAQITAMNKVKEQIASFYGDKTPCKLHDKLVEFSKEYTSFRTGYESLLDAQIKAYQHCLESKYCCGDNPQELKNIENLRSAITHLKTNFYELKLAIESTIAEGKDPECAKQIKAEKETILSIGNTLDQISEADLRKAIIFSTAYVKDQYQYSTPPIYPQGNRLNVQLSISPNDSSLPIRYNLYPLQGYTIPLELRVADK